MLLVKFLHLSVLCFLTLMENPGICVKHYSKQYTFTYLTITIVI